MGLPPVLKLSSSKQVKAYLHPVRVKILGHLRAEARTMSQVAREMDIHPANLTHHFKRLQDAGLIKMAGPARGLEKFYRTVAESFEIRQDPAAKSANLQVLSFLRNDLNSALGALKGDDSETLIGLIKRATIDPRRFDAFAYRLKELVEEFSKSDSDEGRAYTMNLSLYPHVTDYGPLRSVLIKKGKKS
jgi:DNA-binding transcriptional ArsR family regulator